MMIFVIFSFNILYVGSFNYKELIELVLQVILDVEFFFFFKLEFVGMFMQFLKELGNKVVLQLGGCWGLFLKFVLGYLL